MPTNTTPSRREREAAVAVKAWKRESGRLRSLAAAHLVRDRRLAVGDLPDEQPQQRGDAGDGERLREGLRRKGHQPGMMNTGVPRGTRANSHSASGTRIRMQPCETE